MIKYKYSKPYWFFKGFDWMKVYFSPFKFFLPKLYIGKIAVSVPYFLPRKWVKFTYKDALNKAEEHLKKHPQSSDLVPFDKLVDSYKGYSKAVPLKIGFSFCGLGWKTKWRSDDFRFEYSPVWSFVCFGYQIALTFVAPEADHYWESFLAYSYETDKALSWEERVKDCRVRYPQTWTQHSGEEKITIDYWNLIIKEKYLK